MKKHTSNFEKDLYDYMDDEEYIPLEESGSFSINSKNWNYRIVYEHVTKTPITITLTIQDKTFSIDEYNKAFEELCSILEKLDIEKDRFECVLIDFWEYTLLENEFLSNEKNKDIITNLLKGTYNNFFHDTPNNITIDFQINDYSTDEYSEYQIIYYVAYQRYVPNAVADEIL